MYPRYLLTALLAITATAPASARSSRVTPGVSIGSLRIGSTRQVIRKLRGRPTRTSRTHRGATADAWRTGNSVLLTEVVYRAGRAVQIAVSSRSFATRRGASTGSTLAHIRRSFPHLKETTYSFDTESGKGLSYFDDVRQGIAFVFYAPTNHEPGTESMEEQHPWLLVVHRRGEPGVPTRVEQGVADLGNAAAQAPRPGPPAARTRRLSTAHGAEAACRAAVQGFYDWYAERLAEPDGDDSTWMRALTAKPHWFSAELRRALAEDAAAQAKSRDEIVGLDADPIVSSSDPAPRYEVRTVTRLGSRFRATVHPVYDKNAAAKASIEPLLELRGHQWVFVDFVYLPQAAGEHTSSLLEMLRRDSEQRRKGRR